EQQVSEQQGSGASELGGLASPAVVGVQLLELPVGGGQPAPGVRVVDDVVVHERGRVEQLEGAGRVDDGGQGVLRLGYRAPAPIVEERAETLAAPKERAAEFDVGEQVPRD